ncbi:MAG: NTP transferase domain-containing protein [Candidatus Hodarchaeales archaeon]|jgi:choline kinase
MRKHVKTIYEHKDDILIHVIIPSAGIGRRMKSYGCKSLLNIKNEKLLDIQIKNIANAIPSYEIILITGFDSERLMSQSPQDIIKIENEKYYENNVVRSISIGLRATKENDHILIIFGDVLLNEETLAKIDYQQSSIIISPYMSDNEVGCNINNKGNLEYMMFDLPNKWGHIIYLTSKELDLFKKNVWSKYKDKKFCFEIINDIVTQGGKFKCIIDDDIRVMDIDTSKDLQKAQEFI